MRVHRDSQNRRAKAKTKTVPIKRPQIIDNYVRSPANKQPHPQRN